MPFTRQSLENRRKTGQTSVGTTAIPLTKVGDTSSANTTYTDTTVTDGSAWDLSAVSAGDVAVTQDGYKGIITAVDDGNDSLTVELWMDSAGKEGGGVKPTDGQTVTIHRISQCTGMMVKALFANSDDVRVGLDGNARASDFPLSKGRNLNLYDENGMDKADITKVYVKADSGTQTVAWMVTAL